MEYTEKTDVQIVPIETDECKAVAKGGPCGQQQYEHHHLVLQRMILLPCDFIFRGNKKMGPIFLLIVSFACRSHRAWVRVVALLCCGCVGYLNFYVYKSY